MKSIKFIIHRFYGGWKINSKSYINFKSVSKNCSHFQVSKAL